MTSRRNKLRTQGDVLEDTSTDLYSPAGVLRSNYQFQSDAANPNFGSPMKETLVPNLSDAEAMMCFHVNSTSNNLEESDPAQIAGLVQYDAYSAQ